MNVKHKIIYVSITGAISIASFLIGYNQEKPYTEIDAMAVKGYIMSETSSEIEISSKEFKRLDINKDGKITPADYVMIKNEIENCK